MKNSYLPIIYSTTLRPHRSASHKTINLILVVLIISFTLIGISFSMIGAWPVLGFFGLDIILLVGAFYMNNQSGLTSERIDLRHNSLIVKKRDQWGRKKHWVFKTEWLVIDMISTPKFQNQLELRSHGQALIIGSFLSYMERKKILDILHKEIKKSSNNFKYIS